MTPSRAWQCIWHPDNTCDVHPLDDLRPHTIGPERGTCWCHPTPDEDRPDILVHHSMDGRENHEHGRPLN